MATDDPIAGLLTRHARPLERLAASYAPAAADRDDLLQEIALALWTAMPGFRGECSEKTFVLRVAHNRALSFLTKRGRAGIPVDDVEESVVASSGKNPAIAYERKERGSQLLAAARALPIGHRQVITLLLEDLSHREIAEVLGTTENNVAVRANRARAAMRVLLEPPGG
ncbi:MAG TPA: sigma-70 family RNA polymerase sigma factor [Labilithrix sp.]|nr:sigma-70 family RNA polymerase sigma factor [Labilithrix sp.]